MVGGGWGKPVGVCIVGGPICASSVLMVKITDIQFALHVVFGIIRDHRSLHLGFQMWKTNKE